jgi:hypothetical protein
MVISDLKIFCTNKEEFKKPGFIPLSLEAPYYGHAFPIQEGVRFYPNFLAYRTVPQQTVYRSKE